MCMMYVLYKQLWFKLKEKLLQEGQDDRAGTLREFCKNTFKIMYKKYMVYFSPLHCHPATTEAEGRDGSPGLWKIQMEATAVWGRRTVT